MALTGTLDVVCTIPPDVDDRKIDFIQWTTDGNARPDLNERRQILVSCSSGQTLVIGLTIGFDNPDDGQSTGSTAFTCRKSLTATVSDTHWEYQRIFSSPPEYDRPVTVIPDGGTGPYTCAWQKVGGDLYSSAQSPSSCTTSFLRPLSGIRHTFYCESGWVAVVTDATGARFTSPQVLVSFYWEQGS
ncbi:hypothetical protein AB0M02_23320 [Actinoplanes sp. NPDC051861]|uniref:hypothetical protein n=1 Tax=Actinoplanes sp. NPDC051861 TaxID=3155170 RepID=UPI003440B9E8